MKRRHPIALLAGVATIGIATAWGLTISVVASEPAVRRVELPDTGFGRDHGLRKTVVSAAYGDGLGQLGISRNGEVRGPQSIGVDDRERVYVLDSVNRRVVRYANGHADWHFPLPDQEFEDLVISRDAVCVLSRHENRRVIVIDTTTGGTTTLPIADTVPPLLRLFVRHGEVLVECPAAAGRTYHLVGRLDGTRASARQQQRATHDKTPLPDGCSLVAAKQSHNDIAVDVTDGAGAARARLRAHSPRDVAAILDATSDRFGNLYVTWALTSDAFESASSPVSQLVVTRHSPAGELSGRIETRRDDYAEPFRKTVVSETGCLYELTTDRTGARILRWTPQP